MVRVLSCCGSALLPMVLEALNVSNYEVRRLWRQFRVKCFKSHWSSNRNMNESTHPEAQTVLKLICTNNWVAVYYERTQNIKRNRFILFIEICSWLTLTNYNMFSLLPFHSLMSLCSHSSCEVHFLSCAKFYISTGPDHLNPSASPP